ncbi:6-phosphofructokinase 1 [Natranaerovirga pectinivora]|uniref:ATP-dependent 6-phosphofructokinase n=1 Tax=Natranaerovirga pectinivora TaxID=682400 RepID=A0A4R3MH66_9FIRM|nr:ATP-dependent 6-phosphofructokinase [Natranaerovirga pectinivora]TCT13067.1 6-phosphofructokinase 1 [Natranaerovirga pectinivora]
MKRRIGILTSGGDCPGLNAAIRAVAKSAYNKMDAEIIGIEDGFKGLINKKYKMMKPEDFSGILTRGGTILGTARTPFKRMRVIEEDNLDKVKAMVNTYNELELDALVVLGGNGTHKNANLLREQGLNVIGLPKTIDNDIWGTDITFGFHSAVNIATDVIDRIHTTADSHDRVMLVELMGNKAGWLTLYAGIAGGADVILIPEIPFSMDSVLVALKKRYDSGKNFSILAVAEGAVTKEEAVMTRKEFKKYRKEMNHPSISYSIADEINKQLGFETRVTIPGHQQRGGSPSSYDRVLATKLGAFAAELIERNEYGQTVALVNNQVVGLPLEKVAGKLKKVRSDNDLIKSGRSVGTSFGDE